MAYGFVIELFRRMPAPARCQHVRTHRHRHRHRHKHTVNAAGRASHTTMDTDHTNTGRLPRHRRGTQTKSASADGGVCERHSPKGQEVPRTVHAYARHISAVVDVQNVNFQRGFFIARPMMSSAMALAEPLQRAGSV